MKVFQFLVLFHPTIEQKKAGDKDKIIVDLTTVLASDQNSATLLAARSIPEQYADQLDQVEVVVRPF